VLALAGAISFLAFVLVMYLWVRSYFIAEVIYFKPVAAPEEFASPMPQKPGRWEFQWNVSSCSGKAQIVRRNLGVGEGMAAKTMHLRPDDPAALAVLNRRDPLDVDWRIGGLQYFRSDRRYGNTPPVKYWVWGFLIVTVPYWLLVVVTAILPAIVGTRFVRGVRRWRWIAKGMCRKCGYDLRGGGGVCPECGTKVETTRAALRR
jgi:hypothetical protein